MNMKNLYDVQQFLKRFGIIIYVAIGVGHVRYSTAGASTRENAQRCV